MNRIKDFLEQLPDVTVTIDTIFLKSGGDSLMKIYEEINTSDFFIPIFSKKSIKNKKWFKEEIETAITEQVEERILKIIPIIKENENWDGIRKNMPQDWLTALRKDTFVRFDFHDFDKACNILKSTIMPTITALQTKNIFRSAKSLDVFLKFQKSETVNKLKNKISNDLPLDHKLVLMPPSNWLDYDPFSTTKKIRDWSLDEFLFKENEQLRMVVAPHGFGKTIFSLSTIMKLHHDYVTTDRDGHIPILLHVNDSEIEFTPSELNKHNKEFRNKINSILPDKNRKILLIVDSISKFVNLETIEKEMDFLKKLLDEFKNMKIIVTTRPDKKIQQLLGTEEFIGLSPFDEPKVNCYFEQFAMNRKIKTPLSFKTLIRYGFSRKEIKTPLYCFLLAETFANHSMIGKLRHTNHFARRSWIYFKFMSVFEKEKPILRKMVALKKLNPGITDQKISVGLNRYYNIKISPTKILNLSKKILQHESLHDYLLAEYYLESIAEKKLERVNLGIPNKLTTNFLYGLLLLMEEKTKLYSNPKTNDTLHRLLNEYNHSRGKILENFKTTLKNAIEKEMLRFFYNNKKQNNTILKDYGNTLLYQWISFFILDKLKKINQTHEFIQTKFIEHQSRILKNSSKYIPYYMKQFENLNLPYTDLRGVDLSGSVLNNAYLYGSDLTRADLSGSDLTNADLSGSDLTYADISESFVTKGTKKKHLTLKDSHMFHTDLEGSRLHYTNFSRTFLWQCDLAGADLTNTNFSHAILQYVRVNENTDFKKAHLIDLGLLQTPIKRAKNVPNGVEKKYTIKQTISEKKYEKFSSKLLKDGFDTIRFIGIINEARDLFYLRHNDSLGPPRLTGKDKAILVHYAWLGWKLRQKFVKKYGEIKSYVVEYEKLKLIIMPLDKNRLILITSEIYADHHFITRWVNENKKYLNVKQSTLKLFTPARVSVKETECLLEKKDFEMIRDKILQCDNFVYHAAIFNLKSKTVFDDEDAPRKFRLNEKLIKDVWRRWRYRLKFERKIGRPKYAVTEYENMVTITTLVANKENLLFIWAKSGEDYRNLSIHDMLFN